jgi:DNA-binding NtrC family response regulator
MDNEPQGAKARILVADDKADFTEQMRIMLGGRYSVRMCPSGEEAVEISKQDWPDLILLDVHFPDGKDGITALTEIVRYDPNVPVIMLTQDEGIRLVVEAMREGAYNYIGKSEDPTLLLETIEAGLRHRATQKTTQYLDQQLKEMRGSQGMLVLGPSPASRQLSEEIERASQVDVDVLVTGETGTGKELVAREIHRKSGRAKMPFIPLEIASLPETLTESSLFGHEKGAFTGATSRTTGAFEAASGGTLLLDEVGDIPLTVQSKLLRVLQYKAFRRLGGFQDDEIICDTRVIAATHRDLEDMMAKDEFREDLYYRINRLKLMVPPLRERRGDIEVLAEHFISKHYVTTGSRVSEISEEALAGLKNRSWPGNVRQLENTLVAAMVRSDGERITLSDLDSGAKSEEAPEGIAPYAAARARALADFKRGYLERLLDIAGGVVNRAARVAELPQSSLRKMLRESDITRPE